MKIIATPGGIVSATAVNTAIAEDPAATKEALGPEMYLFASDYGVIADGVADDTAELQAAVTAAQSAGKTLVVHGTIKISDEIVITGSGHRILGYGATITQTNTAKNAITLTSPVSGVLIEGLTLVGQGAATHDAAGIYLRKGDLSYIGPDYVFRNMTIHDFRKGTSIANVTTLRMDCVNVYNTRIGHDWYLIQTGVMTQSRVVGGDGNSSGCCFKLEGTSYGLLIQGGEFGGYNKFAITTGMHLEFDGINVEAITSGIIFDCPYGGQLSITNSKIQQSITALGSIVSYNGDNGGLWLNWSNNTTSLASNACEVEVYGSTYYRGPVVSGKDVFVAYATTQGGARSTIRQQQPTAQRNNSSGVLPGDGTVFPGARAIISSASSTGPDDWADNLLIRQRNNNTGTNKWSSLVNDMLHRVLAVQGRTASGNNVETDLLPLTIPAGALRNSGESIEVRLFGKTAANANNKRFRFWWNGAMGGTAALDFGSIAMNDQDWILTIHIQRGLWAGGSGFMKVSGRLEYGSSVLVKTATDNLAGDTAAIETHVGVITPSAESDVISYAAKATWTRTTSAL